MKYFLSPFLVTLLFCALFHITACKTSDKISKTDTQKENNTETSGLSGLNALSSAAQTDDAEETASGMKADLPFSEDVKTGVLDNGMVYYIANNGKPENRIELRLAVDAGSMQEDDDQQGLAHFVEHMAFNGTTNFEKNDLVNFLENTGVRFGADLNAYTSFDETVYILQLPTDKEGMVDKGLMVMSDWATGITFANDEIDKERGVIESEWRTRLGADQRMRQAWWPKVFYQTRYANRLPIGLMDIIRNAPHDRFKRFYKDWYRPNLQAIIAVGDLDVDEVEAKIKASFSGLKNPESPREKVLYEVPGHEETLIGIASDKEATNIALQMYIKHEPLNIKTLDDYRTSLLHQLYNGILNKRFEEIGQDKDAPFIYAGAGYGSFVRSKDVYYSSATPKEDGIIASLKILLEENKRVLDHGFTDSELEREKLQLMKKAKDRFNEKDKTTSARIAGQCVAHFLQDEPLFGPEKDLQLIKEFLPGINLKELNALAKKWFVDQNRAIVLTAPEKESVVLPSEEEIRKVLAEFNDIETEPYKDKFLDMPLMAKVPESGSVISSNYIDTDSLNITEFTLSNGVKVIMKPTDFQNDKIQLNAFSPGGTSLVPDEDYMSAQNAAGMVAEAGVGAFDQIALDKKMTGKTIRLTPYIGELYEGFFGFSSVEDFETLLKMVHLYGTNPRKDPESFERVMNQTKEQMKNIMSNPRAYFQDQLTKQKFNNHPRRIAIPSMEQLDKIDYDKIYSIYQDRFADFSDFTFVLVGNFEPETIQPLLEQYLASLPSSNRKESWKDVGVVYNNKGTNNSLKKGLAPQANVYLGFYNEVEYNLKNMLVHEAMTKILSIMVRENLREDKGGVYSPYVGSTLTDEPKGMSDITIYFQCAPENVENLVEAVKEEVNNLKDNGPSDENFNKAMETLKRTHESDLEKNNYWIRTLVSVYSMGGKLNMITDYNKTLETISKEEIKAMANRFLDLQKANILSVKPEKETVKEP